MSFKKNTDHAVYIGIAGRDHHSYRAKYIIAQAWGMAAGPSLKSVHFEVFGRVQGEFFP